MIKFNFAAAAALLGAVAIAATSANAQSRRTAMLPNAETAPPTQSLGGPIRQGSFCWVSTDPRGFGYWRSCAGGYDSFASAGRTPNQQPQPIPEGIDAYASARDAAANQYPGGGGGGGGSDSGGGGSAL